MKKAIFVVVLCLFAGAFFSFLMDEDDQRRNKAAERRVAVERIMEAFNVRFHKDNAQTSIIFQLVPGDSVKFECEDCPLLMGDPSDPKGTLGIAMQSLDGTYPLDRGSFNKWLKVKSANGKFGLVFSRDGLGEKVLLVRSLRIWRKTRQPTIDKALVTTSIVDMNNIYIDKFEKENTNLQTTFYFKFKSADQLLVTIKGVNGAVPDNIVCQVFKDKEEFDKTPIPIGEPVPIPKVDGGADRFAFEFSHISEDIKGTNIYHIDIFRTPMRDMAFEEPVILIDTADTVKPPTDSVPRNGDNDLFLEYLARLAAGSNIYCITPEAQVTGLVHGQLVLGMTKRSKICIDLPLTDECTESDKCTDCDTLFAFWMGAGQDLINRYQFADSVRKLATQVGILESFARSKKYPNIVGGGIFPTSTYGEDLFFAVIDQSRRDTFLSQPFEPSDWDGDLIGTFSTGDYMSSYGHILKFDVARPLSLCVCNNNSLSSVPFMFKFQQYLGEPVKPDTSSADDAFDEYEEAEETEVTEDGAPITGGTQ